RGLSGGEKARLLMALTTRDAPHMLILDEPTNHLDIDARDALVRALADYEGAVILISHDPHLVELVADRLLLVAEGKITPFEGDLDDYRAQLGGRGAAAASKRDEKKGKPAPVENNRPQNAPLRARLKGIEVTLSKLTEEAKVIEGALANPKLYESGKNDLIARATARRAAIAKDVERLETEWLGITERLEAA
ncbi:MAG: glycosyl transferase family 1, partial [Rubritepida sp.]|nr:glycosyl transferase family 1 [Rubritepida sp.]